VVEKFGHRKRSLFGILVFEQALGIDYEFRMDVTGVLMDE